MMKNRRWLLVSALLLCVVTMAAAALPGTVAYIAGRANTVKNTFRIEYLPPKDITVPVRVHKTVECMGEDVIGPAGFAFQLENKETGKVVTMSSREDGWATTDLIFTADDVGKTYRYCLRELNGGREFVTYDEKVYDITVSLQLNEEHEMSAVLTIDGAEVNALKAEFVNLYQVMDIPETGDSAQPLMWLLMLIISAAGLVVLQRNERILWRASWIRRRFVF